MKKGLIHLYFGEGKGKTSSASGAVIRAVGRGYFAVFIQFLKDGGSGEIESLKRLSVKTFSGKVGKHFFKDMTCDEKRENYDKNNKILRDGFLMSPDILVLDEVCAAVSHGLLDEELLYDLIKNKEDKTEIIMTGRNPADWMIELSDYVTEFKKIKHPKDMGIMAREGIEY